MKQNSLFSRSINMNSKIVKSKEVKNVIKFASTEILFKVLVLGDFGVGKTSIVKRYAEGTYTSSYKITIGADFAIKRLNWDQNTKINLQVWDIAGHERFGYLTRVYYKYSIAAAIVFDLSRIESFDSVEKWASDLRSKVQLPNGTPIPVILLANKSDVAVSTIATAKIQELCAKYDILAWYMTSAKDNSNIDEAFMFLVHKAMENRYHENNDTNDNIILNGGNMQNKRNSSCCR